jgi:hypothetical protein
MPNRPDSAFLPKDTNFVFWPEDDRPIEDPAEIQAMYSQGFAGAWKDPVATAEFENLIVGSGGSLDGEQIAQDNGLSGAGEGKLVIPFVFVQQLLPGVWPGAAQQRGDCVAHDTKNACLVTMCCDIVSGQPDAVSGKVEGLPEIDPVGIAQGALSSEAIYWYRGYSGDGWSCEAAATVACTKSALWLRNNYPELGIDLRKYSGSLAGKYGRTAPPSAITTFGQKHLIRTSTRIKTFADLRDYLANGYGISTCGGEGWSNQRNEDGVSKRQGSWSHALAIIGVDDRQIIKDKYKEPLVLVLNSWGKWNSGGRRILGTTIDIPEGAYWTTWSSVSRRSMLAFSGANGWPAKKLPPLDLVVG